MTSKYPLQLLDAKAYITDLTQSIINAKVRINLISLVISDDVHTHKLIEALIQATRRGITITIAADVFTYGEFGGYFSPFQRMTAKSRDITALVARLRKAGITFTWLGKGHKLNPFAGVTHLKWAIVDNITYCFGGINLYEEGIESVDYMFKSTRPELADQISHQHQIIIKTNISLPAYPGYMSESDYGTIYIDSGKRHDSMIYNRLVTLASTAKHILVVTQYCPSGPLARQLRDKSDIYYNQPSRMEYPAKLLIQYGEIRTGLRSQYTRSTYLHAKFMIFTMPDGQKIALTGSHNFSHSGVMFGTREIALETSDQTIIQQLETFAQTYVY